MSGQVYYGGGKHAAGEKWSLEVVKEYYAHSLKGRPPEEWQALDEHLKNVAKLAADFARPFGGEKWAYLAGLWHDLGKYSNAFQAKLCDVNEMKCRIWTK